MIVGVGIGMEVAVIGTGEDSTRCAGAHALRTSKMNRRFFFNTEILDALRLDPTALLHHFSNFFFKHIGFSFKIVEFFQHFAA